MKKESLVGGIVDLTLRVRSITRSVMTTIKTSP